jgi:PhnB protein
MLRAGIIQFEGVRAHTMEPRKDISGMFSKSSLRRNLLSALKPTLTPYLHFNGNTAEAMKFYQSVLGGEVIMQTFGEANMAQTPEEKSRIVHASLKNEACSIMASDGHINMQIKFGDNVSLSLMGHDASKLTDIFKKFAQGGRVTMPLAKQFWGDTFGMVTDKFGVHWMVNIDAQSPQ